MLIRIPFLSRIFYPSGMNSKFTAQLFNQHNEMIAVSNGVSVAELKVQLLRMLEDLPDGSRGIIYDNDHGLVIGRYALS